MTPELWQRLKPLYDAALELAPSMRDQYVEQVCGNDHELKRELIALLKAGTESTWAGEAPLLSVSNFLIPDVRPFSIGERILGRFEIVRHLGTGGMGEVYEATDLELGRIALKTIRPEIAGNPNTLARFRKEVQLARKAQGQISAAFTNYSSFRLLERSLSESFSPWNFLTGRRWQTKSSATARCPERRRNKLLSRYALDCRPSTRPGSSTAI